jgi:hypothetical protein
VEIYPEQDEWPQQNGECCRDDSLGVAQVGEILVRVRNDQAHDEVDRDEQSASYESPDKELAHTRKLIAATPVRYTNATASPSIALTLGSCDDWH